MLMPSKLVGALKKDHEVLRDGFVILKSEEATMEQLRSAFMKFAPELKAHAKAEESVVYDFMLTDNDLRIYAKEGKEEHRLAEQLVNELGGAASGSDETWRAKAKVLAELVEHHVSEEESDIFPDLKKKLTAEMDEHMQQKYEAAVTDFKKGLIKVTPSASPFYGDTSEAV